MNKEKAEAIVTQLLIHAAGLRYGSVSFTAKVHEGRVFEVSYTKTEQTRERAAERTEVSEGSPPVKEPKKDNDQ